MNPNELRSKLPHLLLLTCVLATAAITIFFIAFIFHTALPIFESEGLGFITGTRWSYSESVYGIRIFIIGTLMMTGVALLLAVPVSVFTAVFLSEFAPSRVAGIMRPMVELLVGIPSVVYGIFGFFVLENIFQHHIDPLLSGTLGLFIPFFHDPYPNTGIGILLASTILAVMILPTIIALSEDAMRAVPFEYKEASFALGATHWETIRKVVLPTASGGILAATILGMMRAMGETMAIVMLLGNCQKIPSSVLDTGYAMTSMILNNIGSCIGMGEARSALFGIAAVLFAMEILFVAAARKIGSRL
jgi:phosphate transport system permease protein